MLRHALDIPMYLYVTLLLFSADHDINIDITVAGTVSRFLRNLALYREKWTSALGCALLASRYFIFEQK